MPARHHVDPAAALRAVRVAAAAQRADRVRCARTGGRHADERAEVAVEIAEQVGLEMAAAKPDVYAALRAYIVAQVGDAVTHWGAEVERLRVELATAEQHLADATRDLLGLDAAAKPCEDAAHASPDTDPKP